MADYDLGTAHGQIVIDYDDKGSKRVRGDFAEIQKHADTLASAFVRLKETLTGAGAAMVAPVVRVARTFGLLSGGAAIVTGLSRATGTLSGALLALRGGAVGLAALTLGLGNISKYTQDFPRIIRLIVLMSSSLGLLSRSGRLIQTLAGRFSALNGASNIVKRIGEEMVNLGRKYPILSRLSSVFGAAGIAGNRLSGAIHTVARLAVTIGLLRAGIATATKLAKVFGVIGASIAGVTAAIQVIGGLIQALEQLSGVVGLLPGLIFAAGASFGTLALGASGVGAAIKQIGAASVGAGRAGGAAGKKLQSSAKQVESAERAVADAYRSSARTARDGAEQIADQRKALAEAIIQRNKDVADAEKAVTQAVLDSRDAQLELNKARAQAIKDIRDLKLEVAGLALNEKDAELALKQARDKLREYQRLAEHGDVTQDQLKEAGIAAQRAALDLQGVRNSLSDSREEMAKYGREGLKANDGYSAALKRSKEAQDQVRQAEKSLQDARTEGNKQVLEQQIQLARTIRSVGEANADANRQIADAQRNLKEAQQEAAQAAGSAGGAADKFNEALKSLSPNARAFVMALKSMYPQFQKLKNAVQDKLFAGLAREVKQLGSIYFPVLKRGLGGIAQGFNGAIKQFSAFLKKKDTVKDMSTGFSLTKKVIDNLSKAIQPLSQAFLDFAVTGLKVINDLSKNTGGAANSFAKFIREARDSGKLKKWIEGGVEAVKDLWRFAKNIYGVFKAFFGAFDKNNKGFIKSLADGTEKLKNFMNSAKGQSGLKQLADIMIGIKDRFVQVAKAIANVLGPAIKNAWPFISAISQSIGTTLVVALKIANPFIQALAKALGFIGPVAGPIVGILFGLGLATKGLGLGFKLLTSFTAPLIGGFTLLKNTAEFLKAPFTAIGVKLLDLQKKFPQTASIITNSANGIKNGVMKAKDGIVKGFNAALDGAKTASNVMSKAVKSAATSISAAWTSIINGGVSLAAKIGPALSNFGTAMAGLGTKAWNAAKMVGIAFAKIVAQAAVATAGFVKQVAVQIAQWAMLAAQAMAKAVIIGIAWLIANPWAIIAAAVIAIVVLIIANWDKIKNFLKGVWDGIKNIASNVWNGILDFFSMIGKKIWGAITNTFNSIKNTVMGILRSIGNFFKNIWNGIADFVSGIGKKIWGLISSAFGNSKTAVWDAMTAIGRSVANGFWNVVNWFKRLPGNIIRALGNLGQMLGHAGWAILQGLWNGIVSAGKWLWNKITDFFEGIKDGILNILGINSPSKFTTWVGEMMGQGLAGGILSMRNTVSKAAIALAESANMSAQSSFGMDMSGNISNGITSNGRISASAVSGSGSVVNNSKNIGSVNVTIPLDDVKQVRDVEEFFNLLEQRSRAGSRI